LQRFSISLMLIVMPTYSQFDKLGNTLIGSRFPRGQSENVSLASLEVLFDCVRLSPFIPVLTRQRSAYSIHIYGLVSLDPGLGGQFGDRLRQEPMETVKKDWDQLKGTSSS
jgi:hypothetical protein